MHALDALLRRAVDPVRHHPPRAGHHLPGRRVRPRRRPPRRRVRRARGGRLQRRRGAGDRVRVVVARRAHRRPGEPRRRSASTSACCTRSTTSSTSCARSPRGSDGRCDATEIPDTVHEAFARVQRGPPPTGRDRDAAGGVLGVGRHHAAATPAESVRVAADPDEIARAADLLAGAERPSHLGRWRRRARRRDRGADRGGRVPPGRGGHHPSGQGRLSTTATRSTPARRG